MSYTNIFQTVLTASIVAILMSMLISTTGFAFEAGMREGAEATRTAEMITDITGTSGIFSTVTNVLLFVVGAISVIMIIIGGIKYVISGGDSSKVTSAKNTILYAVVGIVIALLAYAVVNFVLVNFSASGGVGGSGALDV